jgi:hypothetical protein
MVPTSSMGGRVAAEPQFSSAWRMSDAASGSGQRRHFRLLRLELAFVIVGALLGAINNDASRIIAAISFVLAIVMRAGRIHTNPVADWHNGRAAAESLKTMCWRYAVCAAPFGREVPDDDADAEFVSRLKEVVEEFKNLRIPSTTGPEDDGAQITAWMRATRALPLEERKEVYRQHRIHDQYLWYGGRADAAARTGGRWSVAVLGLECVGAGLAMLALADLDPILTLTPGTLLGVVASLIAAAAAWTQARQYGNLASAYRIAQLELSSISDLMPAQRQESDWSAFVDSAEGAISREHTMWKAARTGGAD